MSYLKLCFNDEDPKESLVDVQINTIEDLIYDIYMASITIVYEFARINGVKRNEIDSEKFFNLVLDAAVNLTKKRNEFNPYSEYIKIIENENDML